MFGDDKFRGVPNGHEFTSLLLAILNSDGKGKNIPDESICNRVKALNGPVKLTTYVSLTCTNCPDVVQALNAMATLNPEISHEMVDGAINQEEVAAMKVQGVPSVFADGKLIHVGRGDFGELLGKLEAQVESQLLPRRLRNRNHILDTDSFLHLSADTVGHNSHRQTFTGSIDSCRTSGRTSADDDNIVVEGREKLLTTSTGEKLIAPAVIVATGASWRRLNVPGESEYIGRGVAFCPHCDGPFYKGKHVAVVGGGNSGVEAAIDLAGICSITISP